MVKRHARTHTQYIIYNFSSIRGSHLYDKNIFHYLFKLPKTLNAISCSQRWVPVLKIVSQVGYSVSAVTLAVAFLLLSTVR